MTKLKTPRGYIYTLVFTCWIIFIVGCIPSFPSKADQQLDFLKKVSDEIGIAPASTLLQTRADITRSAVPKCATVYVRKLLHINDTDLQEVVEFYETTLDPTIWRLNNKDGSGITFRSNRNGALGITDNYVWYSELQDAVAEGEKQFETLYLVNLVTFVEPDMTTKDCI